MTQDKKQTASRFAPALRWLRDRLEYTSASKLAEEVGDGISATTILKLKNGNYEGDIEAQFEKVEAARVRSLESILSGERIGFIDTEISRRVISDCRAAQRDSSLVIIEGPSQIGKSDALRQYQQYHDAGRVVIVRCPVNPTIFNLARRTLAACDLEGSWDPDVALERISGALTPADLLIIDEAHQPFYSANASTCVQVWEWIRELYDATLCGMVIATTKLFSDNLMPRFRNPRQLRPTEARAATMAGILSQLERRGEIDTLPDMMDERDTLRILAAYGLPAPTGRELDYVVGAAQAGGIGRFTRRLRHAAREAARHGEVFAIGHFVGTNKRMDKEA